MSYARNMIHSLGGCEGGDEKCDRITELLDRVEDDRAHTEAEKLRGKADELSAQADNLAAESMVDAYRLYANEMDPYRVVDGQLVRKSDGKPVTL